MVAVSVGNSDASKLTTRITLIPTGVSVIDIWSLVSKTRTWFSKFERNSRQLIFKIRTKRQHAPDFEIRTELFLYSNETPDNLFWK